MEKLRECVCVFRPHNTPYLRTCSVHLKRKEKKFTCYVDLRVGNFFKTGRSIYTLCYFLTLKHRKSIETHRSIMREGKIDFSVVRDPCASINLNFSLLDDLLWKD